ncbi:hypothetical protein BJV82DRAFT_627878 [Fennellomyces sp. T-0311]|nr:hypothetical protein BJV82DRAFT_627878 [Fennellomyces sp. T-0311]
MLLTNHYTTPPHEPVNSNADSPKVSSRRPSLDPDSRTLFPLSSFRHHPYSHLDRTAPSSSSSSRRGSLTDPALHATCRPPLLCSSPPPSPSQRFTQAIRPSQSDQADLANRFLHSPPPSSSTHTTSSSAQQHASPWRRDSLPSISHLTRPTAQKERHPLSNGMWLDEGSPQADNTRRHSIAVSSSSNGYYGSPLSSAGSSPRAQAHPSPPQQDHHPLRHAAPPLTARDDMPRRQSTTTMYSRSPELRVSHKLAERKRRKEMKDLFDELRDILPVDKGLKTSKWEILSKALDYISMLQQREGQWNREKAELRRELASLKNF